ncbi:MAG: hypothetical protein M3Q16_09110 [Pseudomonadota bacterium]|nr:hypothetical protein [Pseudomonadota bacterium]
MSSKSGVRSKDGFNVTTKEDIVESVNETKAVPQAEPESRERRNGYEMISTDAYYRTERRGNSFGGIQDWQEATAKIDDALSIDGPPEPDDMPADKKGT